MAFLFYTILALSFIVVLVCLTIIHARMNPGRDDAITRMGHRTIEFFTRYKKNLKRLGSAASALAVAASLGVIVWFFLQTLPQNPKADERIDDYIENSTTVSLVYREPRELADVRSSNDYTTFRPVYEKYNRHRTIYTGLRIFGNRAKPQGMEFYTHIFQDATSLKYYAVMWASSGAGQLFAFGRMLSEGVTVEARVNRDESTAPGAGTLERPIPVLMWTLPGKEDRESYAEFWITEPQYRNGVYLYLAYIMPKDEFKRRFGDRTNN